MARGVCFARGWAQRRSVTTPSLGAGQHWAARRWWLVIPPSRQHLRVRRQVRRNHLGAARESIKAACARGGNAPTQDMRSLRPARMAASLIWSAAEGHVSQAIEVGSDWVEHVAWSPDGQWLAALLLPAGSAPTMRMERRSGDLPIIPAPSARSRGRGVEELATALVTDGCAFFDASTGAHRQKFEWQGSLVSMALSS